MAGGLRFDLDDQRRWSLSYHAATVPVALIRDATLGVWVGDTLATLADLEDISVGNRRPPGGESLVIRGRTPSADGGGGVWVEAEFAAWDQGPERGAQGTITISVFPDRLLATIRGVRFLATAPGAVFPGTGPLVALLNGYESASPCRLVAIDGTPAVSHGALALTRGARGLALAFDPGGPGDGRITLAAGTLDAVSEWQPPRPLRPEGDTATLGVAYLAEGDGLAALSAAATPASTVDRERLAALAAPAGWSSRSALNAAVSEERVLANLEFCAATFDARYFRYFQIDDGYQRAAGDWETNAQFPRGHRWLTDRIHASGFLAGLWIAPFAVSEPSGVPAQHPGWLLKDRPDVLDGAHPEVQQWLYDLARRVVRDWGYDALHIDGLAAVTAGMTHHGGLTDAEAYRRGIAAIRDGLGTEAFLLAEGAPLQHAAGIVNGMRVGPDVEPSWGGIQVAARSAALRSFYHRAAWLNDPGRLVVRPPLTLDEARVWASVVAAAGGVTLCSDDLPQLPAERVAILQKTVPVARTPGGEGKRGGGGGGGGGGRVLGSQVEDVDLAPAIVIAGGEPQPLVGPWRFRTGDDPRYAARDYDDEAWEEIAVPEVWERSGHADYDGRAWYRTRFALPARARTAPPAATLEIGKIDDADETFINGVPVGQTRDRLAYRRYAVPADALNWGGENILAVRVLDAGGPGGIWSLRRDHPAGTWVVQGAPSWWTIVFVNWTEEPLAVQQALAPLGIPARTGGGGGRFAAYDVWQERPLPDVARTLEASLAPHAALVVALRPTATRPQVIGTSRHIIQGVIDIADEQWEAATRTLSGTARNLDGRPYAITIAVPRALRPATCKADAPCTVRRLESGHAVIEWPAGTTADITWSVTFTAVRARGPSR
ncbi:MAG: alpha-galactosidase [Gemmatimonadales bacterium]|nr:alpha-galactosidase [Gemmatimonadales bacterium]